MAHPIFGINSIPQNPIPGQQEQMPGNGPYDVQNGGVVVSYNRAAADRMDFQIHTIKVLEPNKRYDFDLLAKITNDRILGFFITSDEYKAGGTELDLNVNHSQIQLTIDNEEIISAGVDASLFTSKITSGYYENIYPLNEKADGSQIKGAYTSGPESTFPVGGYEVKLYFWSSKKNKK